MTPRITLKLATSLDGKIATSTRHSQWITGPESRREVHRMRAAHDAVLTGIGTVLADNPQMTARDVDLPNGQPARVILDSSLRLPPDAKILKSTGELVMVFHAPSQDYGRISVIQSTGAICVEVGVSEPGLSLPAVLSALSDRGVQSVMVEAGSSIATSFLKSGLVHRLEWFRAPMIIGNDGLSAIGHLGVSALDDAHKFVRKSVRSVGRDIWETYEKE
ncbi:MAG: riboflavin biosynthesis protein RibD [Ponticaulis sp.]|nr:riboflavin biosynthesis protein RibD [Ponticaulis sp.]